MERERKEPGNLNIAHSIAAISPVFSAQLFSVSVPVKMTAFVFERSHPLQITIRFLPPASSHITPLTPPILASSRGNAAFIFSPSFQNVVPLL